MKRIITFLVLIACLPASRTLAAERSATDLLPETTVVYGEIDDPSSLLATLLEHPLRDKLESLDEFRQLMRTNKEILRFRVLVQAIETRLGMKWPEAVDALLGEQLVAAVDGATNGVVLLAKTNNVETRKKVLDNLVSAIRENVRRDGGDDPFKNGEYRGFEAVQVGPVRVALVDQWLVATNNSDLGKQVIDRYVDQSDDCLSNSDVFVQARESASRMPTAWLFADLKSMRKSGFGNDVYGKKSDNPGTELLVGGIIDVLEDSPYVSASLDVSEQAIGLSMATPFDADWFIEPREYYFGVDGKGQAPELLDVKETLLSISTYRDVRKMWVAAPDLFDERINAELAKTDANLTTLFSGRDFGDEVLGAIGPQIQLLVARQHFVEGGPQPSIKLPSFAGVFRLREPEKMRLQLKVTYQSLIGFLNVVGAMNGQPQFVLGEEKIGDAQLVTATYLRPVDEDAEQTEINYNFSPTVAFADDRFLVSSTRSLAAELVRGEVESNAVEGVDSGRSNMQGTLRLKVLRDVLADNKRQLVSQNMLDEGHDRETAERQIDLLLQAIGWFEHLSLNLSTANEHLRLDVSLETSQATP